MVIYPKETWYRCVDKSDVDEIIEEHLTKLSHEIVESLFDDARPEKMTFIDIVVDPPALWAEHRGRRKALQVLFW